MAKGKRYEIFYNLAEIKNRFLIVLILSLLAIFVACAPRASTKMLQFFFDGVPENQKKDSVVISSNTGMVLVEVVNDSTKTNILAPQASSTTTYFHTPYKEKACSKCHNIDDPGKKSYGQEELCNTCHTDLQTKYSRLHGPVASGFCTACHAPHFSENKNLLLRKGQDLCTFCHEIRQVMKNETHAEIGKDNCTECHNPHGGSSRFILN
jgi:predicted CXXCH cytochrome family protein